VITKPIRVPKNWQQLPVDPLANEYEFGIGIDMEGMARDMKAKGYDPSKPIILRNTEEGLKILDGRHRHTTAIAAGVTPTFALFDDTKGNAKEFVEDEKLNRQHFDASTRAMHVAAKNSRRGFAQACVKEKKEVAKAAGIGVRTLDHAQKVQQKGSAKLNEAVMDGTIAVSDAAKIADLSHDLQDVAVARVKEGKSATAAKAVTRPVPTHEKRGSNGKAPKNGQQKFDWHKFDNQLGYVIRMPDAVASAYDCKDSEEYRKLLEHLDDFVNLFMKWKKRLLKIKG
jgi:hypothetical protein